MAQLPVMPLYTDALLGDTLHLSAAEFGAYMLLLVAMWRAGGSLPDDDATLRRIARTPANNWPRMREAVIGMLTVEGGRVTQKRLGEEFEKASTRHARRVEAGRKRGVNPPAQREADVLPQREAVVLTQREDIVLTESFSQKADKSLKTLKAYQAMLEQEAKQKPSNAPLNHIHEPIEERETIVSPKKTAPQKRGSRIAADWEPSDIDRAYAASKGCSPARIAREAEAFRNYWLGVGGERGVKLDWPATWRNWILNGLERKPEPVAPKATTGWSLPAQSPGRRA